MYMSKVMSKPLPTLKRLPLFVVHRRPKRTKEHESLKWPLQALFDLGLGIGGTISHPQIQGLAFIGQMAKKSCVPSSVRGHPRPCDPQQTSCKRRALCVF
jgi:hypothetical protein